MKKFFAISCILLLLAGCKESGKQAADPDRRYSYLIEMIKENESFLSSSSFFDISVDMARIASGYRYYITIDNPLIAMYDIELIAIEEGVDYRNQMAANVGIFEEKEYNMVPNQANIEKGFVKGIVASGVSDKSETTLYIFVQFRNADYSQTHGEYFKLDVVCED